LTLQDFGNDGFILVSMVIKLHSGEDTLDIVEYRISLFDTRFFQSTKNNLFFTSNEKGLNHLSRENRTCRIALEAHDLHYGPSTEPFQWAKLDGMYLAPLASILLNILDRWRERSHSDPNLALHIALKIARLIEYLCKRRAKLHTKGFKGMDALRIMAYQLFQIVRQKELVQRLIDLQIIIDRHKDVFRWAPPLDKPKYPTPDTRSEWASVTNPCRDSKPKTAVQPSFPHVILTADGFRHSPVSAAAAFEVKAVLENHGYEIAIFGSLASWLYGAKREPKVRSC
jgi:hypothetical protein